VYGNADNFMTSTSTNKAYKFFGGPREGVLQAIELLVSWYLVLISTELYSTYKPHKKVIFSIVPTQHLLERVRVSFHTNADVG